jgi:hypothetical protein
MYPRASIAKTVLTSSKFSEVATRDWHCVVEEVKDDASSGRAVDCEIKLYSPACISTKAQTYSAMAGTHEDVRMPVQVRYEMMSD